MENGIWYEFISQPPGASTLPVGLFFCIVFIVNSFRQAVRIVKKPWGEERWFAHSNSKDYAGKILLIRRGCRLSLQYHREKDETIFVDKGRLKLIMSRSPRVSRWPHRLLGPGDSFHIPPGTIHRFEAVTPCRLIEVSVGPLDDVVRLQDDYGR